MSDQTAAQMREAVAAAIAAVPRLALAQLPTPLERLEQLGAAWGLADLWIKRDDLTGLAFGGNKARKLEFLAAHAQQKKAGVLVTGGRTQSNHARDTALVARRLGMDAGLILSGTRPNPATANVLLLDVLGADVVWARTDGEALRQGARLMAKYMLAGRRPYMIPAGASNPRGTVGYVNALLELVNQCATMDTPLPDTIVVASGTGGTCAGLLAGCLLLRLPITVIGVCVADPPYGRAEAVLKLVNRTCKFLGFKATRCTAADVHMVTEFLGDGYALNTPAADAAITTMARHQGILLDPVYTGKALAGLHGLLAQQAMAAAQRILFWHTGGTVGLFR